MSLFQNKKTKESNIAPATYSQDFHTRQSDSIFNYTKNSIIKSSELLILKNMLNAILKKQRLKPQSDEKAKDQIQSYKSIPATLPGRLAMDKNLKGMGLGKILLIDALRRNYEISKKLALLRLLKSSGVFSILLRLSSNSCMLLVNIFYSNEFKTTCALSELRMPRKNAMKSS